MDGEGELNLWPHARWRSKREAHAVAPTWRGKACVYTEQGKLDEAEALYKKCLALNPDDGNAKRELEYIKQLRAKPTDTPPPAALPK